MFISKLKVAFLGFFATPVFSFQWWLDLFKIVFKVTQTRFRSTLIIIKVQLGMWLLTKDLMITLANSITP